MELTLPAWVQESVATFGRQFGLTAWALTPKGTAALRFEHGVELQLELTRDRFYLMLLRACDPTLGQLQRLLQTVHPDVQGDEGVRAALHTRRAMAMWVASCPVEEVTPDRLEALFNAVWEASEGLPND